MLMLSLDQISMLVIFLADGVVIAGIIMSLFKLSRNGVRMLKELFIGMVSSLIFKYCILLIS